MTRHIARAVLGSVLLLAACDKKDDKPAAPKTGGTVGALDAAKDAAGNALKENKDKAVAAGESKLKEFSAQLDTLKKKAADAAAEQKPAIDSAVKELDAQLANANTQLQSLKSAASDAWQKASADFQTTVGKLGDSFKTAMDKYK